jgi:AcrR family transcriptional regulator
MAKTPENQRIGTRQPRQERSRHKVQLIFEATSRLLEKRGLALLNTNAIAESAGVSIGTLYQFFPNKEAILDGLADREVEAMSDRVSQVMQSGDHTTPHSRVAAIVQAVVDSYGSRRAAHQLVMEHSLSRGGARLSPLLGKILAQLSRERNTGAIRHAMDPADAFVLVHSFAGVLRGMVRGGTNSPHPDKVASALARLVTKFV